MEKKCFKCEQLRPLEHFYKHAQMADGHLNKCKDCAKLDVRSNRAENADYYRAYNRVRSHEKVRVKVAASPSSNAAKKRWRTSNMEKKKAHDAVSHALRSGRVVRPDHCSVCRTLCTPHGHHDDYSKPLVVRWLCSACHSAHHRKYDVNESRDLVESRRKAVGGYRF